MIQLLLDHIFQKDLVKDQTEVLQISVIIKTQEWKDSILKHQ